MQVLNVGAGTIQPGTGMAQFIVQYRAIVYKPFKDEVVDGTVTTVNKVRSVQSLIARRVLGSIDSCS